MISLLFFIAIASAQFIVQPMGDADGPANIVYAVEQCIQPQGGKSLKYKIKQGEGSYGIQVCRYTDIECSAGEVCENDVITSNPSYLKEQLPNHDIYIEEVFDSTITDCSILNEAQAVTIKKDTCFTLSAMGMQVPAMVTVEETTATMKIYMGQTTCDPAATPTPVPLASGVCSEAFKTYGLSKYSAATFIGTYQPTIVVPGQEDGGNGDEIPKPQPDAPKKKYVVDRTMVKNIYEIYELNQCFSIDGEYYIYEAYSKTEMRRCKFSDNKCQNIQFCDASYEVAESDYTDTLPEHMFFGQEYNAAECPEEKIAKANYIVGANVCTRVVLSKDIQGYITFEKNGNEVSTKLWSDSACNTPHPAAAAVAEYKFTCGACTNLFGTLFEKYVSHEMSCNEEGGDEGNQVPIPGADAPNKKYVVKVNSKSGNIYDVYELNKCYTVDGKHFNYRAFSKTSMRKCEFSDNKCTVATSCEEPITVAENDYTDNIKDNIFYAEEYSAAECPKGKRDEAKRIIGTNECISMQGILYITYVIEEEEGKKYIKPKVWSDNKCKTPNDAFASQMGDVKFECGTCTDEFKEMSPSGESHKIICEEYSPDNSSSGTLFFFVLALIFFLF